MSDLLTHDAIAFALTILAGIMAYAYVENRRSHGKIVEKLMDIYEKLGGKRNKNGK